MKRIKAILICLLTIKAVYSQTITEVYLPRVIAQTANKTPYVCRLTLSGLTPNATYRYFNKFVLSTAGANAAGDGNFTYINSLGQAVRVIAPSMGNGTNRYGEFTTDPGGSYTGWFMGEAAAGGSTFNAGQNVFVRISLNDGAGGQSAVRWLTTTSSITVTAFGTAANQGTPLRSTPATMGMAKNFVLLYDNPTGTGRPVAGTFIESDGVTNSVGGTSGYAAFYANLVDGVDKAWGTIIPNNLGTGIQRIAHYRLDNGNEIGWKTSANGTWAREGGGRLSTVNTNGGISNVLVLNGNIVTLGVPVMLDQTITFNLPGSKTYGDADFDPDASSTSGLTVTYTSSDPNVATVVDDTMIHIVGAGTTTITAAQAGDDDFNPAQPVPLTLTVNKAALTIRANDLTWLQGSPMELTVSYTGFVNGDDSSDLTELPKVKTIADNNSAPGPYPVTVDSAASPNYSFTYLPGTITVVANKQPQSIDFAPLPAKVYGDADLSPGATATSALPVTYTSSDPNVATITANNLIHIVGAGTTTITASQGGNPSWEPARDSSLLLTVSKATLTITAENKTRVVGQPNPPLTVVYSGFVNGDDAADLLTPPTVTTTAGAGSDPGEYDIEVKDAASNNYTFVYVNGKLTVTPKRTQTITFSALPTKKYGDAALKLQATASSGLTITFSSSNGAVAIVSNDTVYIKGAGTATITASQTGNADYAAATEVAQTLAVQKVLLTIQANDQTRNEGQPNPAFTVTYSGFVNNETTDVLTTQPAVTTTATASALVGVYPITVSGAAAANYNMLQLPGTLSVLPLQGNSQTTLNAYCYAPGQLQVNVHTDSSQRAAVQLFDAFGVRLLNVNVSLSKGFNTFKFPLGNVIPGLYYLRISTPSFMLKEKVNVR